MEIKYSYNEERPFSENAKEMTKAFLQNRQAILEKREKEKEKRIDVFKAALLNEALRLMEVLEKEYALVDCRKDSENVVILGTDGSVFLNECDKMLDEEFIDEMNEEMYNQDSSYVKFEFIGGESDTIALKATLFLREKN